MVMRTTSFQQSLGSIHLRASHVGTLGTLAVCAISIAGCAAPAKEVPLPPQTVTPGAGNSAPADIVRELPPEVLPPAQPPVELPPVSPGAAGVQPPPAESEPSRSRDDGSLLILGAHDGSPGETTNRDLVEAARRERERRRQARPVAVINDENISEQAKGGRLTVGTPRVVNPEQLAEARETLDEFADKEEYWRSRARDIRQRWREAFDSVERLEDEAAEWRRRFYAAEDIAVRDREIKPAWDRSQDLLGETRRTIEKAQDELDLMYEEGRYQGALDGWLREGIELEPWPDEVEAQAASAERSGGQPAGEAPPR